MRPEQVSGMYVQQAKKLEEQGKFKDAERLYVTVNEPDQAIAMYKNKKMWNDMIRLVKAHYKDMAQESHLVVAKVRTCGLKGCTCGLKGCACGVKGCTCALKGCTCGLKGLPHGLKGLARGLKVRTHGLKGCMCGLNGCCFVV